MRNFRKHLAVFPQSLLGKSWHGVAYAIGAWYINRRMVMVETATTPRLEASRTPSKPVHPLIAIGGFLVIVYLLGFVFNGLSMPVLAPSFTFSGKVVEVSRNQICIRASQQVPPLTARLFPSGYDREVLCGAIAVATFSPEQTQFCPVAVVPKGTIGLSTLQQPPALQIQLCPVLQGKAVDATITWLPVSGSLVGKPAFVQVNTN
jgi:hypothetical protein